MSVLASGVVQQAARCLSALALGAITLTAAAQSSEDIASHRLEIAQQRAALEEVHERSRAECYQRFAVNDCLLAVKRLRGEQMGDLRRQEIALNDLERKRKSAAQLRTLDEHLLDSTVQKAQVQRLERSETAAQKQLNHDARVPKAPVVPKPSPAKTVTRQGLTAAERAAASGTFEQRQLEAQQRQQEAQNARAKRTKPLAQPLPADGALPTPLQSELSAKP